MSERYGVEDDEVEIERERLAHLATARDPKTTEILTRIGLAEGWHCLEVGAGTGSVSAWMAERVGERGQVMSTDIDLQFHVAPRPNLVVRSHDITTDPLPGDHFDVIHARAVLQHLPERNAVIDRFVDALKPGGWLVLEDGHFGAFAQQTLPEPYGTVHRLVAGGTTTQWRDPEYGLALLAGLRHRGFTDLDVIGDVWAMRPGEPGGEWWFLAIERAGPRLVEAGMITDDDLAGALAQIRDPGFVMMSTLSLAVFGRKPQ